MMLHAKIHNHPVTLLRVVFTLLVCLTINVTWAGTQQAGVVLAASGAVTASGADSKVRTLRRRAPFFVGDIVHTAADARAQLRFSDGALLALRPDSDLRIDDFQYDPGKTDKDGNRSAATLLKGGLRTITGVIGKQDPQAYKVSTPVATIGVRGTNYEAVLQDGGLTVAAWRGRVVVENSAGSIMLGADQAYSFAAIAAADQPPEGLMEPPEALQGDLGGEGEDQAPPPAPEAGSEDEQSSEQTPEAAANDMEGFASGETDSPPPPEPLPIDSLSGDTATACDTCDPPQQNTAGTIKDLPTTQDLRFSNEEWSLLKSTPYMGMMILGGPNSTDPGTSSGFFGGHAILGNTVTSPVIADRGVGPDDPAFDNAPIQQVFRQDLAAYFPGPANPHVVMWGEWNGEANIGDGPIIVQTDATDPGVVDSLYKPVWFAVVTPATAAALGSLSSYVIYNTPLVYDGDGSGGAVSSLSFTASIDFNNGLLTGGNMSIINGDNWAVNFTGTVTGGYIFVDPTTLSGTVNISNPVTGSIGAMIVGNNAEALVGGFDLEQDGNPAVHVEGLFTVECANAPNC